MTKSPTNIGASVRARLLRLSKERREDFQLLLTRYANERLLYRLSASKHVAQFVLKGAALFTIWTGRAHRATRDLDLLGFGDTTEGHLRLVFEEILQLDVGDDGVDFDVSSFKIGPIRERRRIWRRLGSCRIIDRPSPRRSRLRAFQRVSTRGGR